MPLKLLEELITKYYEVLLKNVVKDAKIGDLIKMMEFHKKMAPGDAAQKELWASIEKIRKQVLDGKSSAALPEKPADRPSRTKKKND